MAAFHWLSLFLISSATFYVNAGKSKRSPIMTNDVAKPNQFRYAVAIVDDQERYACSGGIIEKRYILSAAHCFVHLDREKKSIRPNYSVYAGIIDLNSAIRQRNPRAIKVKIIYFPSGLARFQNDIALLKLEHDLPMQNGLQKLGLPPASRSYRIGEGAVMPAFGASKYLGEGEDDDEFYGILRFANMQIVSRATVHWTEAESISLLPAYMIKSSNSSFGLTEGDCGAPLVDHLNKVIGVMAGGWNMPRRETLPYGVFTKVSAYLDFIKRVLNSTHIGMEARRCNA